MSVKKIRKISLFLLYFGIFCIFSLAFTAGTNNELLVYIQIIIGVISMTMSIISSFIFWRCPYCNERFEIRHGRMDKMNYCPYCSQKIE